VVLLDIIVFTVNLLGTSVKLVQTSLVEESSGSEETSSIASSIVGQTSFKTVLLKVSGVSSGQNLVTLDSGVDDLADDSGAGDSSNESILRGVIFAFVLGDQSLSGVVVSLSLSSSTESGLEPLVVGSGLINFYENHFR